jgi:hypothetical protein
MHEEILKRLEAGLDRRSFLRGSSVGIAALLGVAAASPLVVFAQAPQDRAAKDDQKASDPKDAGEDTPTADDKSASRGGVGGTEGKFYDRDGVEVGGCPECGHNMDQQGRTWICENCGYSYVE